MVRFQFWFIIFGAITLCNSVRINMQGSVSLGKEVLETLSHYMRRSVAMNRRAMNKVADPEPDIIKYTIQTANVGKGMKICNGKLGNFIRDYVVLLASAIETILEGVLDHGDDKEAISKTGTIFVEELKPILLFINDILANFNERYKDMEADETEWLTIVKKISAKFLKAAVEIVTHRIDGRPEDIEQIKKKLSHQITLAIVLGEIKFEKRLCETHHVCQKDHEATEALNTVLGEFANQPDEKAQEFIKYFYENKPYEALYFVSSDTMHELQVILSDLSYTSNSPAKEVLKSVSKAVNSRWKYIKNKEELPKAFDQQLVQGILSDMDYFYRSKKKAYPFESFVHSVNGWVQSGGKLTAPMKQVVKEMSKKLQEQDPDLLEKLANEVKVFLELTVDPE